MVPPSDTIKFENFSHNAVFLSSSKVPSKMYISSYEFIFASLWSIGLPLRIGISKVNIIVFVIIYCVLSFVKRFFEFFDYFSLSRRRKGAIFPFSRLINYFA